MIEFNKAVSLKPNDAVAHRRLGIALNDQGSYCAEAIIELRKAIELKPEDVFNHLDMAVPC